MARPRTFEENEVIERAMHAFWRNGYDATAIGDLEKTTGISRISIYNAFGDKEGLFLRALDHYHSRAKEIYHDGVAVGGLDAITGLFDMLSQTTPSTAPSNNGCLMVNTVLDIRRASPQVQGKVETYRTMLTDAFTCALRNARDSGDMTADDVLIDDRAEFLVGLLWGALATIRVNCETGSTAPLARIAKQVVEGWRKEEASM